MINGGKPVDYGLDLAVIGNGRTAALVEPGSRLVWWCFPRFDGDPIFSRLLAGDEEKGFSDVVLENLADVKSNYVRNTAIVETILTRDIRNVVWLAADVHYVQANAYDPSGDGEPDFHEFIAGPLSANPVRPVSPAPTFRPTNLFSDSGYFNFGLVTADQQRFQVQIVDAEGTVRHTHQVTAR